jgi:hypothetical protein
MTVLPPESPFPDQPWCLRGEMWTSLALVRDPLRIPSAASRVFPGRLILVMLLRYHEGTLRYDELAMVSPIRVGLRIFAYTHRIWVDSVESLWGGRKLWGIPKELAQFHWADDCVKVDTVHGPITELRPSRGTFESPRVRTKMTGLAVDDSGQQLFCRGDMEGKLSTSRITIGLETQKFPCRNIKLPVPGFGIRSLKLIVGEHPPHPG